MDALTLHDFPVADTTARLDGVSTPRTGSVDVPALDDASLAECAGVGCKASFAMLVERHERRVYAFLLRRCGSPTDADDLCQETFLHAWRSVGRYDPAYRFTTWLYTIAVRRAATWRRRLVRMALAPLPASLPGDTPDPAARLEREEDHDRIWTLVDRVLGPAERSALWLRYAEGLSDREIARVLDRPPGSVRVLLHRARRRLSGAASQPSPLHSPVSSDVATDGP